jgi:hypothetical protein
MSMFTYIARISLRRSNGMSTGHRKETSPRPSPAPDRKQKSE